MPDPPGWLTTLPPAAQPVAPAILPSPDGGYLTAGEMSATDGADLFAAKLDAEGQTLWLTVVELPGEQEFINAFPVGGGYRIFWKENDQVFFQNIGADGQVEDNGQVEIYYYFGHRVEQAQNGDLLSAGWNSISFADRMDDEGNLIWWRLIDDGVCAATCYYNDRCLFISERMGGDLLTGGFTAFGDILPNGQLSNLHTNAHLTCLSPEGDTLWRRFFEDSKQIARAVEMPSGEIIAEANSNTNSNPQFGGFRLYFLDSSGFEIWSQYFAGEMTVGKLLPHGDGTFTVAGAERADLGLGLQNFVFLKKLDTLGNELWHRRVSFPIQKFGSAILADDGGYTISAITGQEVPRASVLHLDENGNLFPNLVHGRLAHDFDGNCQLESTDGNLPGREVWFFKNNSLDTFRLATDSLGNFAVKLDTGSFEVQVKLPDEHWTSCQNTLTFNNLYDTLALDLLVLDTCPDLHFTPVVSTACGEGAAEIDLQVSGGFGPGFQFQWSNGSTDSLLTGLASGQYLVTVTDGNCFHFDTVDLQVTPSLVLEWQRSWGGSDYDFPAGFVDLPDGSFLVAGRSHSSDGDVGGNYGSDDIWLVRQAPNGDIIWQKHLGSSSYDEAYNIGLDGQGNIWLSGRASAADHDFEGGAEREVFLMKLDMDGNRLATRFFIGNGYEEATAMYCLEEGGAILAIQSKSDEGDFDLNIGEGDAWLIKTDEDGGILWKKNLSEATLPAGVLDEEIKHISLLPDGGFLLSGSKETTDNNADFWMLRTDTGGNVLWEREMGGSLWDVAYASVLLPDGNYLWAGGARSGDGDVGPHDNYSVLWMVKTDPEGNLIWDKMVDEYSFETHLLEIMDGEVYVAGGSYLFRMDSSGNLLAKQPLSPVGKILSVHLLPGGEGLAILARSDFDQHPIAIDNHGKSDFWLIKSKPMLPRLTALPADTLACPGDEILLTAQVPGCGSCTYLWDDGSTGPQRLFTVGESGFANVVVTLPNGCQGTDYQVIEKNRLDAVLFIEAANCGEANGEIWAAGKNSSAPWPFSYGFLWENGETGFSLENLPSGNYSVTVSDGICEVEKTGNVGLTEAWRETMWELNEPVDAYFTQVTEAPNGDIFGLVHFPSTGSGTSVVPAKSYFRKYNPEGELLWEKQLDGGDVKFTLVPGGGFAVAGNLEVMPENHDFHLKRLDATGELVWEKAFPAPGEQEVSGLCLTPEGGFLLVGSAKDGGGSVPGMYGTWDSDGWLVKTNASGEVIWSKIYGGTANDKTKAIIPVPGGGYVVAGQTFSQDGTQLNGAPTGTWLFKINEAGEMVWNQTVEPKDSPNELPTSIKHLQDGGFWYGRHRFDAGGNPVWEKDFGTDFVQLPDGSFIGVDTWVSGGGGGGGGALWFSGASIGFSRQGDTLWQTNQMGKIIQLLSDGNFLVAGQYYSSSWGGTSPPPPSFSFFLKKIKAPVHLPQNHPPDTLLACLETPFPINTGNPGQPHLWNNGSTEETLWADQAGSYSVEVGEECGEIFTIEVVDAGAGCLENISQSVALCAGEAWQGQIFTSDTLVTDTVFGAGGTQVISTEIEILPTANDSLSEIICPAGTLFLGQTAFENPGQYLIHLQNQNGCDSFVYLIIDEFPQPLITAETKPSCPFDSDDGRIDLTVDDSSAPYTFLWSNGATTEDLEGLPPGLFSVSVADGNQCVSLFEVEVMAAPGILLDFDFGQPCPGAATGSVLAQPTGGGGDFSFLWATGETTPGIDSLSSGTYFLTVTDGNECTSNAAFPLLGLPPIEVEYETAPPGPGLENGSIDITHFDGQAPLHLVWDFPFLGNDSLHLTGLGPGIYTATLTDGNGCSDTLAIELAGPTSTSELENVRDIRLSPNPVSGTAWLSFVLEKTGFVGTEILNAQGQKLPGMTHHSHLAAGRHEMKIVVENWPDGVYFVVLKTADGVAVRRLVRASG